MVNAEPRADDVGAVLRVPRVSQGVKPCQIPGFRRRCSVTLTNRLARFRAQSW